VLRLGANIVDQLAHARISWKAYMEAIPGACSTVPYAGTYALKHDPFMYYDDVRNSHRRCRNVVPLGQLSTDLAAGALPRYAWITPNLCHDMHDCSVTTGDAFLSTWVPQIVAGLGTDGILVVLFDEGSTSAGCCGGQAAGGHVAGLIAGPGAGVGVTIRTSVDQYSVLKLIEDAWGLRDMGSAASAPTILGWQVPSA
jgi:Phosphoesterase family.